jgi:hypothetical protein
LHQSAQLLTPGGVPLFLSAGSPHSLTAIVTHCGHWGPPRAELLSAPVVKTMRRRRSVEGKHRVVFGTQAAGEQVVAACGWPSNTAFVERLHLRLRQRVAAMGRRSATPGKSEDGWRQQLVRCQGYPNCVWPHARLRRPLAEPVPTNGSGSGKGWRPCPPAMAAG